MAWRPTDNLIEGELDNRVAGKVTGWLRFLGMPEQVTLELDGDFKGEILGKRLRIRRGNPTERNELLKRPGCYMERFAAHQTGEVGKIELERNKAFIEWYGDENGRVVIELQEGEAEVLD